MLCSFKFELKLASFMSKFPCEDTISNSIENKQFKNLELSKSKHFKSGINHHWPWSVFLGLSWFYGSIHSFSSPPLKSCEKKAYPLCHSVYLTYIVEHSSGCDLKYLHVSFSFCPLQGHSPYCWPCSFEFIRTLPRFHSSMAAGWKRSMEHYKMPSHKPVTKILQLRHLLFKLFLEKFFPTYTLPFSLLF